MANPFDSESLREEGGNPYRSPTSQDLPSAIIHHTDERLNPWFTMWTRPRQTIRQVIETDPRRYVLLLFMTAGGAGQLQQAFQYLEKPGASPLGFAAWILGGALLGAILFYPLGWVLKIVGGWFGGFGSSLEARAAMGWACVLNLWLLPVALVCNALLTTEDLAWPPSGPLAIGWVVVSGVVAIWQLVVTSCALGEAHQFSNLKGFVVYFFSMLMVMIPLGILYVIVLMALQIPFVTTPH